MTAQYQFIATTAFGLEAIVAREISALGYSEPTIEDGRVRFQGDLSAICQTNLWLRSAERVQLVVGEFEAFNFDHLFDNTKELPWEQWLPVDAKFPVFGRCVRSNIDSPRNVQKIVKRAIVERMRKIYLRHRFTEEGTEYDIECAIIRNRVVLMIDTTGDGLHKRGYRRLVGAAPLRETVAAALVQLSYWNRDRFLVDPFCGSGTIAIEAASIGRNLAPGRDRSFASENWGQLDAKLWTEARQAARDLTRPGLPIRIMARDRDPGMIRIAKQNAKEAGVFGDINFECKDFIAFPSDRDYGCTICNPPFGERMGERKEVSQLHSDMGEIMLPLDTWSHYIFTSAEGFEREFGRRADRRRKIFSGRIPCTYYQYLGPPPPGERNTDMDVEPDPADRDVETDSTTG